MGRARLHLWATALLGVVVLGGCSSDGGSGADGGAKDGAADEGAVGKDAQGGDTGTAASPLSKAELLRIVSKLASDELDGRDEGTPGGAAARAFIIDELKRCGIEPAGAGGTFEQKITTGKGVNILGLIKGTGAEESKRKVILSAHYDHIGHCEGKICNGAYDNAVAVAAIIGVACELASKPPLRSVLVASWDAEEPPTFLKSAMGSAFYVANPVVPLDETDVAIVLDLLGADLWTGFGGHFVLGAELSPEVAQIVAAAEAPAGLTPYRLGLHLAEELPAVAGGHAPWSDYDAFRNQGVPVLFLSDGYTKRYHTPDDEVASLAQDKIPLEAQYLLSLVQQAASVPVSKFGAPTFDAAGADYALEAANIEKVLTLALAPGGLIDDLKLTATSRAKLEANLADVKQIGASLSGGGKVTDAAILALRGAVQRIMCYTGPQYTEILCNLL